MLVPISYLSFGRNHITRISYDLYNQSSRSFNVFGNRIVISKWEKKLFQSGADSTTSYFKVGQVLFRSGAETVISKWVIAYVKVGQNLFESGQLLPSGEKCFFKVGQLFQSGKIISKSSITLQSYDLEKSKTKLTFEINDVLKDDNEGSLIPQNIFEQLDLYLNIQPMKDNVFDATTKEIKSNKEF